MRGETFFIADLIVMLMCGWNINRTEFRMEAVCTIAATPRQERLDTCGAVVEIFGGVEVIHPLTWPRGVPWEAAGGVESMM